MIHYLKQSRLSHKHIVLFMLLGALAVSLFATLQFVIILGTVKLKGYIVPVVVGSIAGALLSIWMQRFSQAQCALQDNNEQIKFVLEGTGIGLWDWNPQTNEVEFDERWYELLGFRYNEIPQTFATWESRVHPDDLEQCYQDIQNHVDGNTDYYSNVHRMRHKDGHWVYILDRGKVIKRNAKGKPTLMSGTHTDITHLKEVEHELEETNRKLKHLTLIDGLTRISNRRALDEHLIQQWGYLKRNGHPFSVLMIDIDFFKEYNDTYGHLEGDDCLKRIAMVLDSKAQRLNDIAVRYGGEEFLVLLSGVEAQEALSIAEEIRQDVLRLKIPHNSSKCGDYLSISIGVSSCDKQHVCENKEHPIKLADEALYKAKHQGRNQSVVA